VNDVEVSIRVGKTLGDVFQLESEVVGHVVWTLYRDEVVSLGFQPIAK
jgi:hypothetical protein